MIAAATVAAAFFNAVADRSPRFLAGNSSTCDILDMIRFDSTLERCRQRCRDSIRGCTWNLYDAASGSCAIPMKQSSKPSAGSCGGSWEVHEHSNEICSWGSGALSGSTDCNKCPAGTASHAGVADLAGRWPLYDENGESRMLTVERSGMATFSTGETGQFIIMHGRDDQNYPGAFFLERHDSGAGGAISEGWDYAWLEDLPNGPQLTIRRFCSGGSGECPNLMSPEGSPGFCCTFVGQRESGEPPCTLLEGPAIAESGRPTGPCCEAAQDVLESYSGFDYLVFAALPSNTTNVRGIPGSWNGGTSMPTPGARVIELDMCLPLAEGNLMGNIIVTARGYDFCTPSIQAKNAQAINAGAVIVYNTDKRPMPERVEPQSSEKPPLPTIPAWLVEDYVGEAILKALIPKPRSTTDGCECMKDWMDGQMQINSWCANVYDDPKGDYCKLKNPALCMAKMRAANPDVDYNYMANPELGYCEPEPVPLLLNISSPVKKGAAQILCCNSQCKARALRGAKDGLSIATLSVAGVCAATRCSSADTLQGQTSSWVSQRDKCRQCQPGTVAQGSGNAHCLACPSGQLASADGLSCQPCPDGWAGRWGICSKCPENKVHSGDRTECVNPPGTIPPPSTTTKPGTTTSAKPKKKGNGMVFSKEDDPETEAREYEEAAAGPDEPFDWSPIVGIVFCIFSIGWGVYLYKKWKQNRDDNREPDDDDEDQEEDAGDKADKKDKNAKKDKKDDKKEDQNEKNKKEAKERQKEEKKNEKKEADKGDKKADKGDKKTEKKEDKKEETKKKDDKKKDDSKDSGNKEDKSKSKGKSEEKKEEKKEPPQPKAAGMYDQPKIAGKSKAKPKAKANTMAFNFNFA